MTIPDIFRNLKEQHTKSIKLIRIVNALDYSTSDDNMMVRDLVVKQAFVNMFTEWEHFLEKSTIAYTLGEKSILGYSPKCYISPLDDDHAYQIIKGCAIYPDWSKLDTVLKIEKSLFENGDPYKQAINGFKSKYIEMEKVRNYIVHNSVKSSNIFDTLVRNVYKASAVGISPTDFLLARKTNSDPCFYEIYLKYLLIAATQIANYENPNS